MCFQVNSVLYKSGFRYTESYLNAKEKENEGIQYIQDHLQETVQKVGAVLHTDLPFLVGNVSGFIGNERIVEVLYDEKYKSLTVAEIIEKPNSVLQRDDYGDTTLKTSSDKYLMIQANLAISAKFQCIVVVVTDIEITSFAVEFNETFWTPYEPILEHFFYFMLVE